MEKLGYQRSFHLVNAGWIWPNHLWWTFGINVNGKLFNPISFLKKLPKDSIVYYHTLSTNIYILSFCLHRPYVCKSNVFRKLSTLDMQFTECIIFHGSDPYHGKFFKLNYFFLFSLSIFVLSWTFVSNF